MIRACSTGHTGSIHMNVLRVRAHTHTHTHITGKSNFKQSVVRQPLASTHYHKYYFLPALLLKPQCANAKKYKSKSSTVILYMYNHCTTQPCFHIVFISLSHLINLTTMLRVS